MIVAVIIIFLIAMVSIVVVLSVDNGEGPSSFDQEITQAPQIIEQEIETPPPEKKLVLKKDENNVVRVEAEEPKSKSVSKTEGSGSEGSGSVESNPPTAIAVSTDKNSYKNGDTIKVSGNVSTNPPPDVPVTIILLDPDGIVAAMSQTFPSSDGSYSQTLIAGGSMQTSGVYDVTAQFGSLKASTTFSFSG